jgi:3-hydroxyacyl-CoA dehydrogenase
LKICNKAYVPEQISRRILPPFHYNLFLYLYPRDSDEIYRVDDAMMAGFGWEIGAFESWDVLGVAKTTEAMKAAGHKVAAWVDEMIAAGNKSFTN